MLSHLIVVLGIVLVAVGSVLVVLGLHVENWSRDLTVNYAETDDDATDPRLRPLVAPISPAEFAALTRSAAGKLPAWRLESDTVAETGDPVSLHFVRTTRLMKYRDDIHVTIAAGNNGAKWTATSRSRVGKGDLGQNPRNLGELRRGVERELKAAKRTE